MPYLNDCCNVCCSSSIPTSELLGQDRRKQSMCSLHTAGDSIILSKIDNVCYIHVKQQIYILCFTLVSCFVFSFNHS